MKSNTQWLPISDMMTGLMMIFLFIAIVFMQQIKEENKTKDDIVKSFIDTRGELNKALHTEFDKDLTKWGAEILNDNTINFKEPEVLFLLGSYEIPLKFKTILQDFSPRYVAILTRKEFKKHIVELRIEGHASSIYRKHSTKEEAYLFNVALSQDRALSVLVYLFKLPSMNLYQEWLIKVFRANGLAFAKRVMNNGVENLKKSQRVEFRVITDTGKQLEKMSELSKQR